MAVPVSPFQPELSTSRKRVRCAGSCASLAADELERDGVLAGHPVRRLAEVAAEVAVQRGLEVTPRAGRGHQRPPAAERTQHPPPSLESRKRGQHRRGLPDPVPAHPDTRRWCRRCLDQGDQGGGCGVGREQRIGGGGVRVGGPVQPGKNPSARADEWQDADQLGAVVGEVALPGRAVDVAVLEEGRDPGVGQHGQPVGGSHRQPVPCLGVLAELVQRRDDVDIDHLLCLPEIMARACRW